MESNKQRVQDILIKQLEMLSKASTQAAFEQDNSALAKLTSVLAVVASLISPESQGE